MVNQWGRDGNFSSSGARSSGAAGIVVAALVALLLGAGGGYTAARLFGGVSLSDVQSRDEKIADLEKQVSDLKFRNADDSDQTGALRARVEELAKANETLKALADDRTNEAGADARAEIAALKKTIEEAGDLRADLNRARRSLQVSELQIIELEDTIKGQRAEIDKLRASLTDAATQSNAGNRALGDQIKALEAALAESRKKAAGAADLAKRIAQLEDGLAQKTAELSAAERRSSSIQKELDAALAANTGNSGESAALRKQLAAARAEAMSASAERKATQASLEAMRNEKEKLAADTDALRERIKSLEAAHGDDTPPDSGQNDDNASMRRDGDAVRAALADMPGFDRLSAGKKGELARRLEDGECVADALKATLGRVPAIALRNLIRDLGSKC